MNYQLYITNPNLDIWANKLCAIIDILQITDTQPDEPLYLHLDEKSLWICSDKFGRYNSLEIYSSVLKRVKLVRSELLVKAIKTSQENNLVFDLTAGLAKDSILIASSGYKVIMVEQNPFLVTVISYFIEVYQKLYPWVANMQVVYGNSLDFLSQYNDKLPVAIYLDPMFQHKKNALAKKDMQLIQMLNNAFNNVDVDNKKLFDLAYKYAQHKLVVKRDNKQQPLVISPLVSYTVSGKTVRYDVYNC